LEAEDALAARAQGETYDPAWYMDLALEIRREIEMVNAETEDPTATGFWVAAEALPA
jgi:hypothetical protein